MVRKKQKLSTVGITGHNSSFASAEVAKPSVNTK